MSVAARILASVRPVRPASFARRRVNRPAPAFAEGSFRVAMQEAIDFHRQKVRLPTRTWRDLDGRAHDRSFVVAGATKDALLADLHGAVDAAIAEGITPAEFRARFESIVARNGWTDWTGEDTEAGRAWRARVIYETNLRTAHAAGRYSQMTDPAVLKVRPYWQYRHGETRSPRNPRAAHVAMSGKVWRADDPIWRRIYPPNDWFCSCGVRPLSARDLKRMGKDGPDPSPELKMRRVRDPATGELVEVPEGIGFGWDHAPGRDWAEGLVPHEMQAPLAPLEPSATRSSLPDVPALPTSRPFTATSLPAGEAPETYARAFLQEFGADIGQAVAYRDAAGHVLPISEELFKTAGGAWKATKRGRETEVLKLAETVRDPDEIWVNWARGANGSVYLMRSYLRRAADGRGFALFEWVGRGWHGTTAFPPESDGYLGKQRRGALLWRRPE
ncbi:MAG TPA: PBECR2 nuclease fold domain-containing protein [Ancylobacter sp.]